MQALWIADAHLSDPASPSYTSLMTLLRESADHVDAVVLLGDFFDLWLGDNRYIVARHRPILDVFSHLRERGVSIHYLKGNHDFLMGDLWTRFLRARIYDLEATFPWDGFRFWASHGENIYKKDYAYRIMRVILRSSFLDRSIRLLSDESAFRLSLRFASLSKGQPNEKKQRDQQTAFTSFARGKIQNGYHAAILGHTHVLQWHVFCVNHAPRLYVNPGSWHEQNTYLWYEDGRFQVRQQGRSDAVTLFDFVLSVP